MANDGMFERARLEAANRGTAQWKRWGPYLAERARGTVPEDYSASCNAWSYFPHDHARARVYRWNEDGLAGISDDQQRLCFVLTLWNGQDAIVKERLFGLTGPEGNHGEDVKEYYFYLDSTPTHSYMQMLYKYPQRAFPYADLVVENARRGKDAPEYEQIDTGMFADDRYFDLLIEYAKAAPDDLLIRCATPGLARFLRFSTATRHTRRVARSRRHGVSPKSCACGGSLRQRWREKAYKHKRTCVTQRKWL